MTLSLGFIGGAFALAAYIPYIASVVRGETNPVRASWITWTLSTGIIFLSSYFIGVRDTIWVPLAYFIGCLVVTCISFKYGTREWSTFDKICMAIVLVSIAIWYFFANALIALLINILIDFVGYLPTLKKLFLERREQEDVLAWSLHFFGTLFNIAALSTWSIEALYPVVLLISNAGTLALALRNKFSASRVG